MRKLKFTYEDYLEAKRMGLAYAGRVASPRTIEGYRTALKLAERLAEKPLAQIQKKDIEVMLRRASEEKYSQSTINQMIAALKGAFDWAIGNEMYAHKNPLNAVQTQVVHAKQPRLLSIEEVEALLKAVRDHAGPQAEKYELVLSLMAYSGLRISEALGLRKDDILVDGIRIVGKGGKEAFVPVKPDVLEAVKTYAASHDRTPYVFYGDGGMTVNRPLGTTVVYRVFDDALKIAGLPPTVTPHTLRHSFATHALRVTKRLEIVQDLLRHADPKTTRRYAQLIKDDVQNEYAKLW